MQNLLISMGVAALISAIKGPKKKAELRAIALKVFQAIKLAYADDPDFSA